MTDFSVKPSVAYEDRDDRTDRTDRTVHVIDGHANSRCKAEILCKGVPVVEANSCITADFIMIDPSRLFLHIGGD